MGKKTTLLALWCSLLCIIYFGFYRGFAYKLFGTTGDEAFIAFCALALFLGQDGNPKKFLNFACSGICGAVWGFIFKTGVGLLMPLFGYAGGPPPDSIFVPAAVIDIFVFTTLAIIVHTFLLRNTIVNNMPYVFLGVATTFSGLAASGMNGTSDAFGIVHISVLIILGILVGVGTTAMAPKIFGPPPPPPAE